MVFKLDISKAYARVKWSFLEKVLTKFGFLGKSLKMIMNCVTSTSFVVLVNGAPLGVFTKGIGLRQGDPLSLSLYLFIIVVYVLIRNLNRLKISNSICGVKVGSNIFPSTHDNSWMILSFSRRSNLILTKCLEVHVS